MTISKRGLNVIPLFQKEQKPHYGKVFHKILVILIPLIQVQIELLIQINKAKESMSLLTYVFLSKIGVQIKCKRLCTHFVIITVLYDTKNRLSNDILVIVLVCIRNRHADTLWVAFFQYKKYRGFVTETMIKCNSKQRIGL